MIDPRRQLLASALQNAGHRLTPQRQAICDFLAKTRAHPSPADVYETVRQQYPTISLATVYNTLAVLRDLGEIVELKPGINTGIRYETDKTPHANLICRQCGRIVDVPLAEEQLLLARQELATDFDLQDVHVTGFGLCGACLRDNVTR